MGTLDAKFKKFTPLKASYAVKVEVWAEGTYLVKGSGPDKGQPDLTAKGKVQSLDNYKKSKPSIVTVTVSMK